jgi:KaiC/GvpD/RAD55 family RecA-like ATPase
MAEISKQITKDFGDLDHYIFSLDLAGADYNETVLGLMSFLSKKNLPGIYLTLNKPYMTLKEDFKKNGIDIGRIIFIDAITAIGANESKKFENCIRVGNPQDLTGISIATTEAMSSLGNREKYVIIDSLSLLAVHNSPSSVAKFTHFMITKMRTLGACGIMMVSGNDNENNFLSQIISLFDKKVKMGGGA